MSAPDVLIVGAGIIGCASAYALASAGARVHLIDARRVGQGASQASAGVLAPYIEGHESGVLRTLGRRSLDLFDAFVAGVVDASGRTVEYARNGTIEVALDDDATARHDATARALAGDGVEARVLGADELREVEPLVSTEARGGLLIPMHAHVAVPELAEALAGAAVNKGAELLPGRRTTCIRSEGGRPAVVTDAGTHVADRVVLAAGSWCGDIAVAGAASAPVRPVRGQLLHLAWPSVQRLRRVVWSADCYLVPWRSGRVLVGATVEDVGFDERATAAGVRDLLEAACLLVPPLWHASFSEVRVGLRPATPDHLPIVGGSQAVPGLIYATGHFRNGVLLAPLTSALVADLVAGAGDDPALGVLTPSRFGVL